jgi:hypothetical protein
MRVPKKKVVREEMMKKPNMISLTELLHSIDEENKEGYVKIDEWRWPDVDHLVTMGFKFMDDNHMQTEKPPKITISKKKSLDEATGKKDSYFYIEEPKKPTKRFKSFNDVIDFFDGYSQPELDKNM